MLGYRHTNQQRYVCPKGVNIFTCRKHLYLLRYIRARHDYAGKALSEDVNAWSALSTIFRDILNDLMIQPCR
jgi:hypothetical protein